RAQRAPGARLADPATFAAHKTEREFRAALAPVLGPALGAPERKDLLRRLKQAEELRATWRMLLGVTDAERFSAELTALAEAALAVAWLMAVGRVGGRHGPP